uniref:Uncharacterized protein n=1 Tax=Physcomitrium patens TaxID=3218 RepID=A0A2K1KX21_PHYPA|nr:hypothetical protein PHYPA_005323 [Physcomitrium patens]
MYRKVFQLVVSDNMELGDLTTFWLNEYRVCFKPPHGSCFLFNGASTVQCTTTTSRMGILGLAFIQKTPFISQLKKNT